MFWYILAGFLAVVVLGLSIKALESSNSTGNGISAKSFAALIIGAIVVVAILMAITVVPAGHVGVKDTFGNVDNTVFQPGIHLKNPVTNVVSMSVKTQEKTEDYATLTNEGLDVSIDLTVLYSLKPNEAPTIYKTVGTNYENVIITPTVRSVVRDVIAEFDAKSIYNEDRAIIATKISERLIPDLEERGILVESVLIRGATLPQKIKDAIEAKKEAEQKIAQKEYEVQTAEMEARRKIVEAQGIADSQAIIDNSLTEAYLKWYWIDGLKDNENVIYVPIGNDGIPIMKTL
jgi:prohibitin 1